MRVRYLIAVILFLGWVGETAAQTVRGDVREDEKGQPVARAIVTATAGGREMASVLSDSSGSFVLQLPSSGSFTLRATRLYVS